MYEARDLHRFLIENYHIHAASITPLGGYSNSNHHITDQSGHQYVLRLSRTNRTRASLTDEIHALRSLQQSGFSLAPHLYEPAPPLDGLAPHPFDARPASLFHWIPGAIPCLWWQQCSTHQLEQIFTHLAALHLAMEKIPRLPSPTPLFTPSQHPPAPLPQHPPAHLNDTAVGAYVIQTWPQFHAAAARLQAAIKKHFPWHLAGWQWIHGDIQLENTLFEDQRFTAFLDFEQITWGAREKDAIFSAFRICKEGPSDEPFRYHRQLFSRAIDSYRQAHPVLCPSFFTEYDSYWKPWFCLDQTMLYLTNAFDRVWQLQPRIGFLPCYNEVLNYHSE